MIRFSPINLFKLGNAGYLKTQISVCVMGHVNTGVRMDNNGNFILMLPGLFAGQPF